MSDYWCLPQFVSFETILSRLDNLLALLAKDYTVPNVRIVAAINNYIRKTVITTVITANTQYRMSTPTVIIKATILTYGTVWT